MTSITKNHKTATILAAIAALAGVLVGASTAGNEHMAFAYKGFFRGFAHIKSDDGKQAIEQPTNIDQKATCETAGGNSPIDASCTNTATTDTTNTGGIGTVRGSTGDDGKQAIEQPTIIGGAVCETAGENSPIDASCTNTAITNTGGIGTVLGSTGDDGKQAIEQPTIIGGAVCETAGENSPIHASCTDTATTGTTNIGGSITYNTGGSITYNTGGSITSITGGSSTSNKGRITGTMKLPFGGFP
ncbi:MAG: hypothetical protein WAM14_13775 [Candidatus Nitrosopolaris sp.]